MQKHRPKKFLKQRFSSVKDMQALNLTSQFKLNSVQEAMMARWKRIELPWIKTITYKDLSVSTLFQILHKSEKNSKVLMTSSGIPSIICTLCYQLLKIKLNPVKIENEQNKISFHVCFVSYVVYIVLYCQTEFPLNLTWE